MTDTPAGDQTPIDLPSYTGGPGDNFGLSASEQTTNAAYAAFDEGRWRRVGADDDAVERLRLRHEALSAEEQAEEGKRLASVHDDDLKAELENGTEDNPYDGTVEEVKALVGDDPARAAAALSYEREGKNRVSLINHLQNVAGTDADDSDEDQE